MSSPTPSSALTIGTVYGETRPVQLNAKRFNRHTFWCGQSGSGKTYALGVVLEQLLLNTRLPLLILDPNSDFIQLGQPVDSASADVAERLRSADIRVLHSGHQEGERLRTRFLDLSVASKAAVLRLDPIADGDEYNELLHVQRDRLTDEAHFLESLRTSDRPGRRKLGQRVENLQVLEWDLWARQQTSANEIIEQRPDATVLDLGGFTQPAEPKVAALSVLEDLWRKREQRRPVLIVIDEAHNICPPNPVTPVEIALTKLVMQIAAEGRKFGLWLLLSTQRPTKIHPNVLSQCDNLGLMRMNSPRDLAELVELFGYAPEVYVRRSASFVQGQSLFAGGFIDEPTLVQVGARLTREGGSDVGVPLLD